MDADAAVNLKGEESCNEPEAANRDDTKVQTVMNAIMHRHYLQKIRKTLPSPIQNRITVLKNLQLQHLQLEAEFFEEVYKLERKYQEKHQPLYDKRKLILSGEFDPPKEDPKWKVEIKEEPEKEDPKKVELERGKPGNQKPEKEDPENVEQEKEKSGKEKSEKEDPEKLELEKEKPEKRKPGKVEQEKEKPGKEDPEKVELEKEKPEKENPEKEEPENREQIFNFCKVFKEMELYSDETKGVPDFWLIIFRSSEILSEMVQEHDEPALKKLMDIKIRYDDEHSYTLDFHFDKNDYFSNSVLTKQYFLKSSVDADYPFGFEGPEIFKSKGCVIDWRSNMNLTVKTIRKKQKRKSVVEQIPNDSFFNFFNPPSIPEDKDIGEIDEESQAILATDFEIGHFLRARIIPKAVLYYTGDMIDGAYYDDSYYDEENETDKEADTQRPAKNENNKLAADDCQRP